MTSIYARLVLYLVLLSLLIDLKYHILDVLRIWKHLYSSVMKVRKHLLVSELHSIVYFVAYLFSPLAFLGSKRQLFHFVGEDDTTILFVEFSYSSHLVIVARFAWTYWSADLCFSSASDVFVWCADAREGA